MTIRHTFSIAFQSLTSHKRRSFLTMLGLIIGIAAVILVMSLGAGAQSLITNQIKKRGTDMIAVLPGASEEDGPPASAFGIVITTLTADDAEALANRSNVPHAQHVASYVSGTDILRWLNIEKTITFTGTNDTYDEVEKTRVAQGRFFDSTDVAGHANVMVLGAGIAEDIFGNQNPVGQMVKLKRKQFQVIGVLEEKGSTFFENNDNAVLIPLTTAQNDLLGIRHVSFIRIVADNEQVIPETVAAVKDVLTERHNDTDFSVRNTAELLTVLTTVTNALKFFLVAIAAVSLFVGGVGIMNIMLISVKEKTKEVGLRKAVGATNSDILKQFLLESALLSLIGGIIGMSIGTIIAYIVSLVVQSLGYDYTFAISLGAILVAVGTSAFIGLSFGTIPARRAARLNPIEALRYE